MKKRFYQLGKKVAILSAVAICALLTANQTFAQGVSINATGTGTAPDASAILDLNIVTKGFLVPRMTQAQRNAITSPANSLLIYQTDNTPGFYYNSGTPGTPVWTTFGGGSGPTAGNDIDVTGTQVDVEPILNYVHTITPTLPAVADLTLMAPALKDLILGSGGLERARFLSTGNLGVGDATPASLFTVGSGDLFQVNSSGNLIAINGLAGYSWPAAHASGVLRNNGTGTLTWGAPTISGAAALTNGRIWIGDASNIAQEQTMSGDATISNTGALTLATVATAATNTKITYNAKGLVTTGTAAILASADFANQGTTTNVLHGNAAGNPTWGAVTGADFGAQVANTVFSGPASGANAIPTFRTMVPLDLATAPTNGEVLGVTGGVLDWVATMTNPMTNAGDMIYAPVAGAPAAAVRFPAGTNGNVLHTTGGLPSWSALNMAGGANEVTGILPVGNGGTGVNTIATNGIMLGAGTGSVTTLVGTNMQTIRNNAGVWVANNNLLNDGANVGIGLNVTDIGATDAILDIIGANTPLNSGTDAVALNLRMGDSQNLPSDVAQISFGYNGTTNLRHNIRTRHNNTSGTANAIDFYLFKPGTDVSPALGSNRVFTIFNDGVNSGVELYGGLFTNASWGTSGQVLVSGGTGVAPTWTNAASGSVTSVSVVSANGLAGTVANPSTTPTITLSTTQTGLLTGNGTAIIGNTGTQYGLPYWATSSTVGTTNAGTATQVLHGNPGGAPTFSAIANGDLPGSGAITMSYGTGVSGSASVALGGTLTINNTDPDQVIGNEVTTATTGQGLVRAGAGTSGSPWTLGFDYTSTLAGNPVLSADQSLFGSTGLLFEGTAVDAIEGLLTAPTLTTADRTWTLPDASGTIALVGSSVSSFSAGTTGFTPNTATTGAITLAGTLNVSNGGTGATTFTSGSLLQGNGAGAITPVTSGTANYVARWTSSGALGIGLIQDNNANIGINQAPNASYMLAVNGKVKSTGINETSDARLKTNFAGIDGALAKVLQMNGKYYDWKTTEFPQMNLAEGRQVGVIAQEIEKILPEVVTTGDDGYKAVEYSHIVPVLIEAIKEQQKIIDGQKSTISDLKASLENVLNRVNIIEKNVDLNVSKVQK